MLEMVSVAGQRLTLEQLEAASRSLEMEKRC